MANKETEGRFNIAVDAMLPQITEEVAAELRKRALESISWEVKEAVQAEVRTYLTDSVLPQVRKELAQHEAEIRAAMVAAVRASGLLVAEKLQEAATKKMASYEGDKVLKDVFDKLFGRGY